MKNKGNHTRKPVITSKDATQLDEVDTDLIESVSSNDE